MEINEKEVAKLRDLLKSYTEKQGTVSIDMVNSLNGCATCSGSCDNFCTHSCDHYCDGHSGSCWNSR